MTGENKEPTCKHTHTNLHKCQAKINEIALPQWQVKRIHEHTHTYTNLPLQLTQWRCHRMICLAWPNFSFFFLLFFLFSFLFFLLFCCLFFKFLFAFIVIICIAFSFRCNWLMWFFSKEVLRLIHDLGRQTLHPMLWRICRMKCSLFRHGSYFAEKMGTGSRSCSIFKIKSPGDHGHFST